MQSGSGGFCVSTALNEPMMPGSEGQRKAADLSDFRSLKSAAEESDLKSRSRGQT